MVRALAVDWSGAVAEGEKLWWAEAVDGVLNDLAPSTRKEVADRILATADRDAALTVGLDFSFSYPAWFIDQLGLATAPDLWRSTDRIDYGRPPFWGWAGSTKPIDVQLLRRTERAAGPGPKSAFQVGGAGAVGTGTKVGLPFLATLQDRGLAVWPFDAAAAGRPTVVEIYPRRFTGPVVKSRFLAREAWWEHRRPDADAHVTARALCCEDAFDAAVSAMALSGSGRPPLPHATDPDAPVEGWIAGVPFPDPAT